MLQAIKNFKREQHIHHTHQTASCTPWRYMLVVIPDGRCYLMTYDYINEQEVIQELRLGR